MSLIGASFRDLGDARALDTVVLDANGAIVSFPPPPVAPANSAITVVPANTTSATLLAANPNRKQFIVNNTSGANIRISLGPVANSTVFSFVLPNNDTYQSPLGGYTGHVAVARQSGTGNVVVTDIFTA
jgi:hypothetical protein